MFSGNFVFFQIKDQLPWPVFHQCVVHYNGDKYIKTFNCSEQYHCRDFAQLTYRSRLREIEVGLRSKSKNFITWVFEEMFLAITFLTKVNPAFGKFMLKFSQNLVRISQSLYVDDALSDIDVHDSMYALESTKIDLCLPLFPWAQFR